MKKKAQRIAKDKKGLHPEAEKALRAILKKELDCEIEKGHPKIESSDDWGWAFAQSALKNTA